jgi:hypothetical protein
MPDIIEKVLGPEEVELIHRTNNLRLLAACDVEVTGCSTGWRCVVGGREIINADIDIVIARGLAVIRGRKDLWPTIPPS